MLSFFPTPYPDELLYSVFARYHLLSGNRYYAYSSEQLFGSPSGCPDFLYAPSAIHYFMEQLPTGIADIRELVNEHTLIPYVMRFAPLERKKAVYDYLFSDKGSEQTVNRAFLNMRQFDERSNTAMRFCPQCVAEERERYGEAYWHRTHQIQLLPICDIHGCNLVDSSLQLTADNKKKYITAEETILTAPKPEWPRAYYVRPLSNTLVTFLKDPTLYGDSYKDHFWCDILADEFVKNGFGKIKDDGSFKMCIPKGTSKVIDVYDELCKYYGDEIVNTYLKQENRYVLGLLAHRGWIRSPEQYALIATALGTDPHRLTIPDYDQHRKKGQYIATKQCFRAPLYTQGMLIDDELAGKMREMAGRGYLWNKRRVAEMLHCSIESLNDIAAKRGIAPFWVNGSPEHVVNKDKEKWHCMKLYVTDEMYQRIQQRTHDLGIYRALEYARYSMEKELTEAGYTKKRR